MILEVKQFSLTNASDDSNRKWFFRVDYRSTDLFGVWRWFNALCLSQFKFFNTLQGPNRLDSNLKLIFFKESFISVNRFAQIIPINFSALWRTPVLSQSRAIWSNTKEMVKNNVQKTLNYITATSWSTQTWSQQKINFHQFRFSIFSYFTWTVMWFTHHILI